MELAVAKGALTIAEGYLVIDKNQLEELSKEALTAKSWTLSDLQARLPRKKW